MVYTQNNMLHFLFAKLPKELVCEIALFEGRIVRAFICDYVGQLYSGTYKKYFGYRNSLKHITREPEYPGLFVFPLEYYSAWSTEYREQYPGHVKKRKPHKFMRPYYGIIPESVLNRERIKIERKISQVSEPERDMGRTFRPSALTTVIAFMHDMMP